MTTIQKGLYSLVGLATTVSSTFAADTTTTATKDPFGSTKVTAGKTGTSQDLPTSVQSLISSALTIIGLVAVCYGIYGGFLMLTAGGDEEKVKKGRTIITQVLIGIVVIFIANAIVRWFLTSVINVNAS